MALAFQARRRLAGTARFPRPSFWAALIIIAQVAALVLAAFGESFVDLAASGLLLLAFDALLGGTALGLGVAARAAIGVKYTQSVRMLPFLKFGSLIPLLMGTRPCSRMEASLVRKVTW